MSLNKFWEETRRINILDKLRQSITLDAFCVRVGEDNGSVNFASSQTGRINLTGYNGAGQSLVNAFTVELWFKTISTFNVDNGILFANFLQNSGGENIKIGLSNRRIFCSVLKGGNTSTITSDSNYSQGVWTHIAVTYDGNSIKIFNETVQDINTLSLASPLDDDSGNDYICFLGGEFSGGFFVGNIGEARVWNRALTSSEIGQIYNKRRGKNLGLIRYYRLNQPFGVAPNQVQDYLDATIETSPALDDNITFETDDYPPLITGASTLGAIWDVIAGQNISLLFPVNKPDDVEFTLCVSYVDEETSTRIRFLLWDDVLDVAPIPLRYRGQVLPSEFRFEAWGRDGAEEAEMFEELVIYLSKTLLPANQRDDDNTPLLDPEPTIDTSLAASWGSAFPISFNEEQYGTCASPVEQDLDVMSDNLPVYGGTSGLSIGILNEDGGEALNEDGGRQMLE